MKYKEAIEFMKLYKYNHINEPCQEEEEGINQVISLLQRSEVLEKITKLYLKEVNGMYENIETNLDRR